MWRNKWSEQLFLPILLLPVHPSPMEVTMGKLSPLEVQAWIHSPSLKFFPQVFCHLTRKVTDTSRLFYEWHKTFKISKNKCYFPPNIHFENNSKTFSFDQLSVCGARDTCGLGCTDNTMTMNRIESLCVCRAPPKLEALWISQCLSVREERKLMSMLPGLFIPQSVLVSPLFNGQHKLPGVSYLRRKASPYLKACDRRNHAM